MEAGGAAEGRRGAVKLMQKISFLERGSGPKKILALGAHADDIEIGCGGTILRMLDEDPAIEVIWVVFSASGPRRSEAMESANTFLRNAREKEVVMKEFRDGYFPYAGSEIKDLFEELKRKYSPDIILTHFRQDLHQDHRLISELTWNTFRNHLILEYEIFKYDGDLGVPSFFVQLPEAVVKRKLAAIERCFTSQMDKSWFSADTFSSMMRLRGIESRSSSKYAEAFYARKMVW
jgi:LmbE family N-acetylglucosaminyl deacetylase